MPPHVSGPNHHTHHNPLPHTHHADAHQHKSARTLTAVHNALDKETERRRVFEALHKEMLDQVLDFIARYKSASDDKQTRMLQSKELRAIMDQARVFLQPNHGIPCSNRDNLSAILSHLDLVLKYRPFGDHDIASLIIEHGARYVRTHHEPNTIDSKSLQEGVERIQKIVADSLLQST